MVFHLFCFLKCSQAYFPSFEDLSAPLFGFESRDIFPREAFPSFCWVSSVSLLVKITFDVKLDIDTAFDFAVGLALVNSAVVVANFSYYQRPDAVIL